MARSAPHRSFRVGGPLQKWGGLWPVARQRAQDAVAKGPRRLDIRAIKPSPTIAASLDVRRPIVGHAHEETDMAHEQARLQIVPKPLGATAAAPPSHDLLRALCVSEAVAAPLSPSPLLALAVFPLPHPEARP